MRRILMLIAILVAAYAAAVGYLYAFQRSFVFVPGGTLASPQEEGLDAVQVMTFTAADGTELSAWYAEAEPGRSTILYFHGNASNVSARADHFSEMLRSGFGLLAVSYRGYPGSDGSPSEEALFSDALELYDWLVERTDAIIIYGESLGTGVAVHVAAEREARALILEAPFTAAVDIARATYPWVPVGLLMHDQFASRELIGSVDEPLMIVHGTQDRVVPVAHGRRLFELAGEPKELQIFEGASHHDLWERGLWPAVLDFLREHDLTVGSSPQ